MVKDGVSRRDGEKSEGELQIAKEKAKLKARAAGEPVTPESFSLRGKVAYETKLKAEILQAHEDGKDLSNYEDSYVLSLVFENKTKEESLQDGSSSLQKASAVEEGGDEGYEGISDSVFEKVSAACFDEDEDDDSDYVP